MLKQILDKEEIHRCLEESDFESYFSFSIKEDVRLYFADNGDDIMKEGDKSIGFLYICLTRLHLLPAPFFICLLLL